MLAVLLTVCTLSSAPDLPPPRPVEPVVFYNKEAVLPKKTTLQGAKTTDVDSDPNEAKISPTASTRHHFHWSGLHRFKVFLASVYNRRGVRNH